jgi:peptidoglycan/LPS O-acetylase OafA/YrhL
MSFEYRRSLGLDVMRAAAALSVALVHSLLIFHGRGLQTVLPWFGYVASIAVDMFFVLSGFLVGRVLLVATAESSNSVGRFALRRLLRTVPSYLLFLVLNLLIWWWHFGDQPDHHSYWFFLQNFAYPQPNFFVESWSLATEEWFYLLIVVGALVVGRRNTAIGWCVLLLGIAFVSLVARSTLVALHDYGWDLGIRKIVIARMDGLAFGMLTAVLLTYRPIPKVLCNLSFFIGMATIVATFPLVGYFDPERVPLVQVVLPILLSLGFAAMLPAADKLTYERFLGDKHAAFRFGVRSIALLANISYALYLTNLFCHRVFEWGFGGVSKGLVTPAQFVVINMIASIGLALICFYFFERPILRWRDRAIPASRNRPKREGAIAL